MDNIIEVDVSKWYVEKWVNDKRLYDECYELLSSIPDKTGGVYHIYENGVLLYVGATINFKQRLTDHLVVNTNTKDFINSATSIRCIPVAENDKRAVFEYKEIVEKKPKNNKVLPLLSDKQKTLLAEWI